MFENEYENPMVLGGDYGDEDSPDQEVRCPHCGRIWSGYDFEDVTEWDCVDDANASAFTYPIGTDACRVCAFNERTTEQERAFIADSECCVDVLEYLLCNRISGRITNYDSAKAIWDILIDTEDDRTRYWVNDLIHSFIGEEAESDFVDWIMEGWFDRVRDGGTNCS